MTLLTNEHAAAEAKAPDVTWDQLTGVQKSLRISKALGEYILPEGQLLEPSFSPLANYRRWLTDGTRHGIARQELFVDCVVITLGGDALRREIHVNDFEPDLQAHWQAEADERWEAGEGWTVDTLN